MSEKADGYVAWHPRIKPGGFDLLSAGISIQQCKDRMGEWKSPQIYVDDPGWRIRPVKLVFLDEDKEGEE